MIKYFTNSFSIVFISWIVGMIVNAFIIKTSFYERKLTHLNFVKSKRLNRILGIGIIKWIVKNTFFKFFNPKLKLKAKIKPGEMDILRHEMTLAEINHLIAFVTVTIYVFILTFTGRYSSALVMMLVNILMNLYPSLLQQENKRRIDLFTKRLY